VKVVLSGEGSDEVLAGYDLNLSERRWQFARSLQRLPELVLQAGASAASTFLPDSYGRATRRVATEPISDWNRVDLPHITWDLDQADKRSLWPLAECDDSRTLLKTLYTEAGSADPLQQLLYVYQQGWLVEDLLMKADKMSMATSIELRTPFLDYRLVEWANRQPNRTKVRRTGWQSWETKSALRRFCANRLPVEIITRPKRGFPVPAYQWLQQGLGPWAEDMLVGRDSRSGRAFDHARVRGLIQRSVAGDSRAAHSVWGLVILEQWLRSWNADLTS